MRRRGTKVFLVDNQGGFDVRFCPDPEDLARFIEIACNSHAALLEALEHALADLEALKDLALRGKPGEFTIGMCRRMDDYEKIIKQAKP